MKPVKAEQSFAEFVSLLALMMAIPALAIDAMLPALAVIGTDLGVKQENDSQLIISSLLAGLAVGQLFYGPFSDSKGRKPAIYLGIGLFVIGSLWCCFSSDFSHMLAGRFLQGLGAAGPRIVSVALVRDVASGRAMARVLSFAMSVFILVPVIAPLLGQSILLIAHWRTIFIAFVILASIALCWFASRQTETLALENRIPVSWQKMRAEIKEIGANHTVMGYAITSGLIFGAFIGYLNSAQQILQELYDLGTQFPLYFAFLALAIGSATLGNTRLVMRYGMHILCNYALLLLTSLSFMFLALTLLYAGTPELWMLLTYLLACFFCVGILFGNLNAIAMEPLKHMAGMGSAVVGVVTTFISVSLGTLIGLSYNHTVIPIVIGFAVLGMLSLVTVRWSNKPR